MLHCSTFLGHLNPAVDEKDLKTGTTLELPTWLVLSMSSGRQPLVTAELPKVYKEAYREILKADPCAVDLHKFGLFFYELGSYVKKFDVREDVSNILIHVKAEICMSPAFVYYYILQTFQARFRHLMDLADNTISDPTIQNRLDMLERKLFHEAQAARTKLNEWLIESAAVLEAANMVVNHKKRKRAEIEDLVN